MQIVSLENQKLTPTFIGSWIISPLSICDELISYFELNKEKQRQGGTVGGVNLDDKNSTDIKISPKDVKLPGNEVFEDYFHCLYSCYQDSFCSVVFNRSENLRAFAKSSEITATVYQVSKRYSSAFRP